MKLRLTHSATSVAVHDLTAILSARKMVEVAAMQRSTPPRRRWGAVMDSVLTQLLFRLVIDIVAAFPTLQALMDAQ